MSDIDWSKAPEGTTHYSPETGEDNPCWVKMLDSGFLYKSENHFNKHKDTPWMKGSFNFVDLTIKPKPESKPAYTQAMADNGELPLVGMEVEFETTFFTTVTSNSGTCEIIAYFSDKVWINIIDFNCVINIKVIDFKPITPPIELIDGERYEFELCFGDYRVGYYKEERNSFFDGMLCANKICGKSEATNIQLLEVKS